MSLRRAAPWALALILASPGLALATTVGTVFFAPEEQLTYYTFAKAIGFPHAYADVMIDAQVDRQAILAKLDELERIARRNGQAIGVGAAFDETIAAVTEWRNEAVARGIEFVGVSALANENRP